MKWCDLNANSDPSRLRPFVGELQIDINVNIACAVAATETGIATYNHPSATNRT